MSSSLTSENSKMNDNTGVLATPATATPPGALRPPAPPAAPALSTLLLGSSASSPSGRAGGPKPLSPAAAERMRKTISELDAVLAIGVAAWLRKRGKVLRPRLTDEQKAQLRECFALMDADGSGAVDADEMGAAFKVRVVGWLREGGWVVDDGR